MISATLGIPATAAARTSSPSKIELITATPHTLGNTRERNATADDGVLLTITPPEA